MENQDKMELQIILKRSKYVILVCIGMALAVVLLLIFKV